MCENITFIVHNWHCVDALSVAPHKRIRTRTRQKVNYLVHFFSISFLLSQTKEDPFQAHKDCSLERHRVRKKGQCLAFFRNIMRMNGKPLKHDNRKSFLGWLPAYKDDTIFNFFLLQTPRTITLCVFIANKANMICDRLKIDFNR